MRKFEAEPLCGFVVVRLPEKNFDLEGRGAYPSVAPQVDGLFYGGIDRMPWFDLDEDHYGGRLPEDIEVQWNALLQQNPDLTGIKICKDLSVAAQLLQYSNRRQPWNELIAIASPTLTSIKGIVSDCPATRQLLGYDVVSLGWWSLLRDGVFLNLPYFAAWVARLNEYGLFPEPTYLDTYVDSYYEAAREGLVEELPEQVYEITAIAVWRVAG
jgi:hypothetical protein